MYHLYICYRPVQIVQISLFHLRSVQMPHHKKIGQQMMKEITEKQLLRKISIEVINLKSLYSFIILNYLNRAQRFLL
jgi:hypothetical protein